MSVLRFLAFVVSLGGFVVALVACSSTSSSSNVSTATLAEGESCGGYTARPSPACATGLTCCDPDPRVADRAGVCVKESTLARTGEACGPSVGRCCAKRTCVLEDGGDVGTCP